MPIIANARHEQIQRKKHGQFYEFLGIPFHKAPEYGCQSLQNNSLGHVTGKHMAWTKLTV